MSEPIILEGVFVNLRPLMISDAKITFNWRQADRARYLNKSADSVEQQEKWITERPTSEYNFVIELKNKHPIGMLSLIRVDLINKHAEPARFLIGDETASRGIPAAIEAMKLLYELAFDKLGLVRISGIVSINNTLMIKWQKYLGMKEEGRLRKHLYQKNGTFEDAICLGLLVDEYRSITLPRMNALVATVRIK